MTSDLKVQGLHVLSVLTAARALVSKCAAQGGTKLLAQGSPLSPELEELQEAVDRMAQFEREAITRGLVKPTTGEAIAQALEGAHAILNLSVADRVRASMSSAEVDKEFSIETEPAPPPSSVGEDDDPFSV